MRKLNVSRRFFVLPMGLILLLLWSADGYCSNRALLEETFPHLSALTDSGLRLIDEVLIEEKLTCALVTINFNYPVRYIRHFPHLAASELRIKLQLIGVMSQDMEALSGRETAFTPPNKIAAVSKIDYEGDVVGGPFLTLYFLRDMTFKVGEGAKHRSLKIMLSPPDTALSSPCSFFEKQSVKPTLIPKKQQN